MAEILILNDYPSANDVDKNYSCGFGGLLKFLTFQMANLPKSQVALDFIYDSYTDMDLGQSKREYLLRKHKPSVIVAMGSEVMKDFGIKGITKKMRGSVCRIPKRGGGYHNVIPSFSFRELHDETRIYREASIEKKVYTVYDLMKAGRIAKHGWNPPRENFNINPTLEDVKNFVDLAIKNKWELGCDIEADTLNSEKNGGLDLENADIGLLGFAWSETDAIVIPFYETKRVRGAIMTVPYWNRDDLKIVKKEITRLFHNCKFIFQNGVGYDVPLILNRGWDFPLENFTDDTMVLHHTIDPESEHNIGFISSIFGVQPLTPIAA